MKQKKSIAPNLFWLTALSTLVAIGVLFYLTFHHFELKFGVREGTSICNINQTLDCDSVNVSSYSEVFGAPLALWGAITNIGLLLLLTWAKLLGFRNPQLNRINFLFAGVLVATSIVMALISFTQLSTFCLFCIITYVTSFLTWFGVWKMAEMAETKESVVYLFKKGDEGGFSYLVFLIAIPVAVYLFNGMMSSRFGTNMNATIADSIGRWNQSSPYTFDTSTALFLKDPSQTYKMQIVEFADFSCHHCKNAAPSLHAFAKSRKDVNLVFLNFPLDGTCNPAINSPGTTCLYAKSVYCGEKQGKGWEIHNWLFDNQTRVGGLEEISKANSLDFDSLKACVESTETHDIISKQAQQGKAAGVRGTPSIFVNGKLLSGGQLIPILNEAYKAL